MRRALTCTTSIVALAIGLVTGSAFAQTTANGPYYATPSWDQTLPVSTRFIVLANMNGEAVLDRETGLVWEKTPSPAALIISGAWKQCVQAATGGRMGWRLPKSDEFYTLLDPTQRQTFGIPGRPAALPVGHPFVGTGGNPNFWTIDQDAPPFNNNGNLIYVAADLGIIQTVGSSGANARSWCVRGPGGATISP
jgi:hypothetical protein